MDFPGNTDAWRAVPVGDFQCVYEEHGTLIPFLFEEMRRAAQPQAQDEHLRAFLRNLVQMGFSPIAFLPLEWYNRFCSLPASVFDFCTDTDRSRLCKVPVARRSDSFAHFSIFAWITADD